MLKNLNVLRDNVVMPSYQVHRLKDPQRQQFRWAPHTAGLATIKPKDYDAAETVEASNAYEAWEKLKKSEKPLEVGDLLELNGDLKICKYIGFEEARWFVPEPVQTPLTEAAPTRETEMGVT